MRHPIAALLLTTFLVLAHSVQATTTTARQSIPTSESATLAASEAGSLAKIAHQELVFAIRSFSTANEAGDLAQRAVHMMKEDGRQQYLATMPLAERRTVMENFRTTFYTRNAISRTVQAVRTAAHEAKDQSIIASMAASSSSPIAAWEAAERAEKAWRDAEAAGLETEEWADKTQAAAEAVREIVERRFGPIPPPQRRYSLFAPLLPPLLPPPPTPSLPASDSDEPIIG